MPETNATTDTPGKGPKGHAPASNVTVSPDASGEVATSVSPEHLIRVGSAIQNGNNAITVCDLEQVVLSKCAVAILRPEKNVQNGNGAVTACDLEQLVDLEQAVLSKCTEASQTPDKKVAPTAPTRASSSNVAGTIQTFPTSAAVKEKKGAATNSLVFLASASSPGDIGSLVGLPQPLPSVTLPEPSLPGAHAVVMHVLLLLGTKIEGWKLLLHLI